MTEDQMLAHVTQFHEARQKRKAEEEEIVVVTMKDVASIQAEAFAKVVDETIVCGVIIDLTNTGVMNETPKASNATIAYEVEHNVIEPASKQSITSNEATSRDKGEPDVVIVYSTNSGPTPLNYAQPTTATRDQVQDMIGQVISIKFIEFSYAFCDVYLAF